ncbi:transposase, partial [bacterium]
DMLKYKSKWYGRNFIQINRFEPTSKTCSNCGWVNNDLALADRVWTCKICDKELDRDINAALNIKLSGLSKPVESLEASGNNTGLLKEKIGV